jgi:hypothetical protein
MSSIGAAIGDQRVGGCGDDELAEAGHAEVSCRGCRAHGPCVVACDARCGAEGGDLGSVGLVLIARRELFEDVFGPRSVPHPTSRLMSDTEPVMEPVVEIVACDPGVGPVRGSVGS